MIKYVGMLLVVCGTLTACAGSTTAGLGQRSDVFQLTAEDLPVDAHKVTVTISASIKTHKESALLFELAKHGSDDYLLFVDINGQSISLPVQTVEETTDTDPQSDPESGTGLRYNYKATAILLPGTYRVTARLPTENVQTSQELSISGGSREIRIKPIYKGTAGRKPPSLRWIPTFMDGVRELKIVTN